VGTFVAVSDAVAVADASVNPTFIFVSQLSVEADADPISVCLRFPSRPGDPSRHPVQFPLQSRDFEPRLLDEVDQFLELRFKLESML
jgi:hypothetical protein